MPRSGLLFYARTSPEHGRNEGVAMSKFPAQSLAFILFIAFAPMANAQTQPAPAPAPASAPAQDRLLSAGEIDALLSPVALYPDNLLAQVLMAATYPLEVIQASRWLQENKGLKGDAAKTAVDKLSWDESVKSLMATPDVLNMMADKLDWTQKLGDAMLAQQADVMDGVQRLRAKADANNKLTTTKQQKVTKKSEGGKQYIAIEPTDPATMYVPYYDPAVVYGSWPYPSYPPYYWGAGYWPYATPLLGAGLAFGAGYALGRWTGGGYWGGNVNWNNNNININRPGGGSGNWNHNVDHRQGVRYNNRDVANRMGQGNRGNAGNRADFRGRDGAGGNRPGGGAGAANRPGGGAGAGNRPGGGGGGKAATRPSGGGKAASRPSGGARPGGGGGGRGGGAFAGAGGGGRSAMASAGRGHASMGGRGGGGGGARAGGGGGGRGGGGGGRGGGGGGGRRSDIALKHHVILLGHLDNGLGFYRFSYNGSEKGYVGVMAQEVQTVRPDAVFRGYDGYLRVYYDKLGVPFQSYDQWIASGARMPSITPVRIQMRGERP
jgi:uncharacterized protein DUF3300/endosialidase-like protein